MIENIMERFPDDQFLIINGFNDCIIGLDEKTMRIIYSVKMIIDQLSVEMDSVGANEYFEFNIFNSFMGDETPIFCFDNY